MSNPTLVVASLSDEQLKKSIDQMIKDFTESLDKMVGIADAKVKEINQKLGGIKLGATSGSGSANTSATKQDTQATEDNTAARKKNAKAAKEQDLTFDQTNTAMQKATQSASKYSEQVHKLAAEIRASKEWQEKGHLVVGDINYYDKERANVSKRDKQLLLSLEEQIVQAQQKEAQEALIAADAKRQQAQAAKEAAQASKGVSSYELGIDPNVSAGRQRQIASTRAASKETEYLRQQVASLLEVEEREIKTANTTSSSYAQLAQYLKNLQSAYQRLGADRIAKGEGTDLAKEIQNTQRAMQKLQQTMSRPVSLKDAMGLSEKTLDDIAYKMRQLASYRSGLNIKTQSEEIEQVNKKYAELQKSMNDIMRKNTEMIKSNTALGRSWNYMKNRLAFYFTVGASTSFVKNLIEIRGQYELLERSIGILIDSAQNGSRIFAELNSMAIKSPFTTMELGAAAKQLVAYDVAAKDVVDTTKRLADMAAAVGVPIERLTYALGQIKSYSYLNARDARMFANTGIPLVKELADMYTRLEGRLVSTADVYDRIKHKMVSYEDVMKVVNEMTDEGGKFFNFQEKAADTLKVKIANLTLAYNNMMNEMGKDSQGVLAGALGATKQIFEHWRDINNLLASIVSWIGLYKAGMLVVLTATSKTLTATRALAILQTVLGQKVATNLASIGTSFMKFVSNPAALASVAISGLAIWLGKAVYDFYDLKKANEAFNKSVVDGAEENIKSIDKFFKDYRKDLDSIGAANESDQQKVWERMSEEIEKTIKNAQQYIDVLNEIQNVADRIGAGKAILEQQQEIEKAAKELASRGVFDLGGGFADSSLAKNLKETESLANDLIKTYGSLNEAEKKIGTASYTSDWKTYQASIKETDSELENFVSKLDKANINKIMGSGDAQTQFANIRNFATIIRDAFLATEEGSKVGYEGQARLNAKLDEWIAKQGQANGIIKERTINGRKYTADEIASIESQRSAWEKFFDSLSASEKKRLDYSVKTNQTSSEDVKEIWDKAAKEMSQNETTAYNLIQDHIAQLRNTPDIVLNVIYRESTQKEVDPQRRRYQERFIEPQGSGVLAPDKYFEQVEENTRKFGRFIKKEGEDNVEWEKRLGQEYQDNEKSLKSLNNQLKESAKLSDVDRKAKEKERDTLKDQQVVLETIRKEQGFDFDQFKKGSKGSKKDTLGDALSKEVQLITDIRKRYDEYKKMGVDAQTALVKATDEYGVSLKNVKKMLSAFGITGLEGIDVANMEMRDLVQKFEDMKKTASLQGNVKGVEALEKAIASLNVEITKVDYKRITDGLNSELGKLKDEYELAVELDANPELGDMFLDMFGIDKSALSSSIDDYMFAVQDEFRKRSQELGYSGWGIDVFKANEDTWREWGKNAGLSDEALDRFKSKFVEAQNVVKKTVQDTVKQTKDLEYKLADTQGKIAIETTRLKKLQADREIADVKSKDMSLTAEQRAFFANQKSLLDLQIKDQENTIARLGDEVLQMLPTYKNLFNSIVEHSEVATRKIAKQWKGALSKAVRDGDNFVITDPNDPTKTATITKKQYGTEVGKVDKELQKSTPVFQKIKEAFKKGEDGTTDWAKGIELLGGELDKLAGIVSSIGNFAEQLGFSRETVEIINDVATSMSGVATMSQGVGQIASGDYIGGAASMLSGLMTTVGTWLDNSDNKILDQIKESERAVKKLENAMIDLEDAANHAYGAITSGAQRGVIANKELQLAELKRQIQLEKSRDSKHRDEDRIVELEGQYKQLLLEVKNGIEDVVNEMLGISSAGDAVTQLVESMIEAFRNGEDAMQAFSDKWDEMIDNMILKIIVSQYMQKAWEHVLEVLRKKEEEFLAKSSSDKALAQSNLDAFNAMSDREKAEFLGITYMSGAGKISWDASWLEKLSKEYTAHWMEILNKANQAGEDASEDYLKWSLDYMMGEGRDYMQDVAKNLIDGLGDWYTFGQDKDSALSALQQGIQGITEDTAGAIEAYLNGISQQIYLHSTLLTEIRDAIVGISGGDLQLGVQSQMLLQLQDSYTVQKSIESILAGVLNPSGRAFAVELIS